MLMKDKTNAVSLSTYNRMPQYLKALYKMKAENKVCVSSVALAESVGLSSSMVKNDFLMCKMSFGKPKVGYVVETLISDIETFLGYDNVKDAILVGAGKLGQALLGFDGFSEQGFNLIAGFDVDDGIIGKEVHGKKILPTSKMASLIDRLKIKIAILTVPQNHAQAMCDVLVESGIRAIWNFTQEHIIVPNNVVLKNENMASSLAVLSGQLSLMLNQTRVETNNS